MHRFIKDNLESCRLTWPAVVSIALAVLGILSSVAIVLFKTAEMQGYMYLSLVLAASFYVASLFVACRYGGRKEE